MKKLDLTLNIILIILVLVAIVLLALTGTACKKAENLCENNWSADAGNSSALLQYTDNFGNPTYFKPVEICKEDK